MWDKLRMSSAISGKSLSITTIFGAWLFLAQGAYALTADDVLNKMESREQASFIAGVVGGLAYSRFLRDKPEQKGMDCIYDWYYQSDTEIMWKRIEAWFSRHSDKPAVPLLYVLIQKECGE